MSDDDILDAAARVVARRGPVRMTLAEVGAEVGLTAAGVLRRFGTKRALLLALSRRAADGVDEAFRKARAAADGPLDALLDALAAWAADFRTPEEVANGLAFLQLDVTQPDFREAALAFFDRTRANVRALLDEAVRRRELRRCDTEALARAVEVAYNGASVAWGIRQEGDAASAVRRDVEAALTPFRTRRPGILAGEALPPRRGRARRP